MRPYRIILSATIYSFILVAVVSAQPVIHIIGGDTVDWGRTTPGRLTREVGIVNIGTETLKIDRVEPSCGCTTAPLNKSTIAPGDTATMSVAVDLPGTSGRQTKHISIHSNDVAHPMIGLTLTAEVVRIITVSPAKFPLPVAPIDSTIITSVQVTNNGRDIVVLEAPVVFEEQGLTIALDSLTRTSLNPGEIVMLSARITPKVEGGVYGKVMVRTSSSSMPNLVIPAQMIARREATATGDSSAAPDDTARTRGARRPK